jgi:superfamily II DNA or RNA helicase
MALPERPLSLARALAPDVPAPTRAKGSAYFRDGAVGPIRASDDKVSAIVYGTREYQVDVTREQDGFIGACECPYFQDRFEVCKHIWAVILAADARKLLAPVGIQAWIEPVDTPGEHHDEEPGPPDLQLRAAGGSRASAWEHFLEDVSQQLDVSEATRPVARYANTEFLYVLDRDATETGNAIAIHLLGRQRKKNGEWGKPQPAAVSAQEIDQLPNDADRDILALLTGAADTYASALYYSSVSQRATFRLVGPLVDRVLPLMAQSGRLYLRTAGRAPEELTPLRWDEGPPWTFELEVEAAPDAGVKVDGALVRDGRRMAPTEPPLVMLAPPAGYLIAGDALARLDHGGAFAWLMELRRAGAMHFPGTAAAKLAEALARSRVRPESLPEDLRYELVRVSPQPRVKVTRPSARNAYARREELQAIVEFEYDGSVVPVDTRSSTYDPQRKRLVVRDAAAEHSAIQRLQQLGFRRGWNQIGAPAPLSVSVEQFPRAVRTLVREGWHVEADGRVFRAPRSFSVQVKSGIDWFELHGTVDFGEGRSASIADLLSALKRGDATVVLGDGTRGMVPEEWLQRYMRVASFGEAEGDHIRYRPTQAALLDALLEDQPAVTIDETFARARAELAKFSGIRPLDPPPSFTGTLREYQREALGWFEFLRRFGFGGCLADDMGLGKTVMVLAMLESRRAAAGAEPGSADDPDERDRPRASLVVVPRSLVFNWKDEAARFAPALRVLDYTGISRDAASIDDHDLVLTTYGTLRRDAARLTDRSFDYVILDEAQAIKNATTASAKAVRLLRGRHRLALSGTPIENHVGELWSLFDFLNPGLLGSARAFKSATGAQSRVEREDLAVVTQAVKPLILRRTKAQVEPELPPRTEQTIHCELEGPQRRFYDDLRVHYRATLLARVARAGLGRSKMQVLEALLRLRQAACHPGLVDPRRAEEPSAKFDVLLPQLLEVVEEGHKALVFSQFTSFLALLRSRLDQDGVVYEYLDGQTRDRAARVQRFNTDEACRVFLISLKAGGLGLNLTAAEYVFLLDPWWNPAVEAQAIDRAHRIGQEKHVFAYRLIAQDTVEEKVAELQQTKRELAEAILTADPALIRNLSADDLEWLLS